MTQSADYAAFRDAKRIVIYNSTAQATHSMYVKIRQNIQSADDKIMGVGLGGGFSVSQELIKAERAALVQAVKALYIPLSLFIACVISAGGMYMVMYTEDKSPGYAFLGVAFVIIVSAFIALIRFQNNYRAKGLVGREEASPPAEDKTSVSI